MNETHRIPERSRAALAPDLQSKSTDNDVPSYAFGQGIMRFCHVILRFVHSASKANQPLCRLLHFATASGRLPKIESDFAKRNASAYVGTLEFLFAKSVQQRRLKGDGAISRQSSIMPYILSFFAISCAIISAPVRFG